jgi:hypothetical protein
LWQKTSKLKKVFTFELFYRAAELGHLENLDISLGPFTFFNDLLHGKDDPARVARAFNGAVRGQFKLALFQLTNQSLLAGLAPHFDEVFLLLRSTKQSAPLRCILIHFRVSRPRESMILNLPVNLLIRGGVVAVGQQERRDSEFFRGKDHHRTTICSELLLNGVKERRR